MTRHARCVSRPHAIPLSQFSKPEHAKDALTLLKFPRPVARAEGFKAGFLTGGSNPYQPHSPEGVSWAQGYRDGCQERGE